MNNGALGIAPCLAEEHNGSKLNILTCRVFRIKQIKKRFCLIALLFLLLVCGCGGPSGLVGDWQLASVNGSTAVDDTMFKLKKKNIFELYWTDSAGDTKAYVGSYEVIQSEETQVIRANFITCTCLIQSMGSAALVEEVSSTTLILKGMEGAGDRLVFSRV